MSDQQRADTLAPNSPCRTPNLDALASEGTRFERCYAANPICSPSRASLLTGLLPHSHGMVDCTHTVEDYRAEFDADRRMWSQVLRDAGYRTGYFGKWHVERSDELSRFGFDDYVVTTRFEPREGRPGGYLRRDHPAFVAHRAALGLPPLRPVPDDAFVVRQNGYRDLPLFGISDEPVEGTQEYFVAERGIEFLHRAAKEEPERPWLLFLSTEAPHEPYFPPREYADLYYPSALPLPASFADELEDRPAIYRRLRSVWRDLTPDDFRRAIARYYAYCSMVDEQYGRVLRTVRELGRWDDTIVVFTSDHGDLMGAHRLLLKGIPAFEEVYKVPLVVRVAGTYGGSAANSEDGGARRFESSRGSQTGGTVADELVSLLDLAPTLTELTLGRGFHCHGRSLAPLLAPVGGPRDNAVSTAAASVSAPSSAASSDHASNADSYVPRRPDEAYAEMHGQRLSYTQRIVWKGRYKYVFNAFDDDELYDLEADPHELRNLAKDPSLTPVLQSMSAAMWRRVHETNDFTLAQAQDGTYRFAAVGPESGSEPST